MQTRHIEAAASSALAFPGLADAAGRARVDVPWQGADGAPLTLSDGWYVLRAGGSGVVLQLNDAAGHRMIELSAAAGRPAYVRLQAAIYETRLFAAARPGVIDIGELSLERLGLAARLNLLIGRAVQALKGGMSLARITALAARAFTPSGTFGVRAAGDGGDIGMLSAADRHRAWRTPEASRLARLKQRPRFFVHGLDAEALADQAYDGFTLDPAAAHNWALVCTPGERLTPDALLLFAEAIDRDPSLRVIIADRWEDGRPSARVAFDPLLYAAACPTPYAVRADAAQLSALPWRDQQPAFAALGVPVAAIERAPAPPLPPRPAAPAAREPASIIIPTRDRADVLSACLAALAKTAWPHEVVIVDNGSSEAETFRLFAACRAAGMTVIRDDGPFNFSRLSNRGASAATGRWLVFMNNDVEVRGDDWLERMIACAALPDAGAVGAKLLYGDGSLQHGGVALGLTELCGHPWRHLAAAAQGAVERLAHTSLRSAVTAALMCVDRARFEAVGGFDAAVFPVTLNDVDLCLKLRGHGWYSLYCADAVAVHPEGVSRGRDDDPVRRARRRAELDAFAERWPDALAHDPWLPPSLRRSSEVFGVK